MEAAIEVVNSLARFIDLHKDTIQVGSGLLAGIIAVIVLVLRREAGPSEKWAKYFAIAFAIMSFQYLVVWVARHFEQQVPEGTTRELLHWSTYPVRALGSSINNLFFLASARELRQRKPAFPSWAFAIALLSMIGVFEHYNPWFRLPDSVFSSYCLFMVGWATFTSISYRRRRIVSLTALFVGSLYSFLQIIYGLNPYLSRTRLVSQWLDGIQVVSDPEIRLQSMGRFLAAALLPLKFGLFISATLILLGAIPLIQSSRRRELLDPIINGNAEYLTGDGIVMTIADSVGADRLELALRLPGQKQGQMVVIEWDRRQPYPKYPRKAPLPSTSESLAGGVLVTGEELYIPDKNKNKSIGQVDKAGPNSSILVVPIRFHGAVIGYLRAECARKYAFNESTIQHLKDLADMVSPSCESYRELEALGECSQRLAHLRTDLRSTSDPAGIKESIERTASTLQDVLSPLALSLDIRTGFESFATICDDNTQHTQTSIETNSDDALVSLVRLNHGLYNPSKGDETGVNKLHANKLEFLESDLKVRRQGNSYDLGKMKLAVPSDREATRRPTLGTNYLHRETIASLAAHTLINAAREHLDSVLKKFSVSVLEPEALSLSGWFSCVEHAATQAGLKWAVIEQPGDDQVLGDDRAINVVKSLPRQLGPQFVCHLYSPFEGAFEAVCLLMPFTDARMWLGVGRMGFGPEIVQSTPWSTFLEHFREIADSALLRITAYMDLQKFQVEAIQTQGMATVAVTTGHLVHQLSNMALALSRPASTLEENLRLNLIQCGDDDKRLIEILRPATAKLWELTRSIMDITKVDDHRPCLLSEAVQKAKNLFEPALDRTKIQLEVDMASDLTVDVPFHVATLAIANLVSNSIDAITSRKDGVRSASLISIRAEKMENMVYCCVTDNGPGVRPDIEDRIFHLNVTSKRGSGGWGLYLVACSVKENGGSVDLTYTGPGGTRLTIRFPQQGLEEIYAQPNSSLSL